WYTTMRMRRRPLGVLLAAEVVRVSVLASGRLGDIGLYRHATWDDICSNTATRSILRSSRTAKSLRELLDQSLCNIIYSDMDSISNTKHNEGALAGVREHGIGCIQFSI